MKIWTGKHQLSNVAFAQDDEPARSEENGHYYQVITGQYTWYDANMWVQLMSFHGVQGHLATITSIYEQVFINNLRLAVLEYNPDPHDYLPQSCWIGLFRECPTCPWQWVTGSAEDFPLDTGSIDLVRMSQVFHHPEDPPLAFREIYRVLCSTGYLAIRNGTQESDAEIVWIKCFPEAKELHKGIIPRRIDISNQVCLQGFDIVKIQAVNQLFASSYNEYYDRTSQRGLSSLTPPKCTAIM